MQCWGARVSHEASWAGFGNVHPLNPPLQPGRAEPLPRRAVQGRGTQTSAVLPSSGQQGEMGLLRAGPGGSCWRRPQWWEVGPLHRAGPGEFVSVGEGVCGGQV